jgi:flagellar hook-associated protein 2
MASSGSVVSVAASTSAAAAGGSVINVPSLVSQLVGASRAPQDALISRQSSAVTTKISALGTLKGALGTFQSSLATLNKPDTFAAMSAKTSDANVFSANVSPGAPPGSYAVTVSTLASAQQLLSAPFAGGSTATIGTGTLSVQLGTQSFSVTLDATNNTVAGLAAAINAASDNPGVVAAVVQGSDGAHLLLSSTETGAANTLQVTETDGGTALAAVTYGTGNTANYTQNMTAQDASFSVAGVAYTSTGNTVTDALTGVTLKLTGTTAPGATATLNIADDTATVSANIETFVSAYNTLQSSLAPLGAYDKASGGAGPMLGDPLLSGVQGEIRRTLESVVGTSVYNTLASLGIITQKDGSLQADSTRLQTALSRDFNAVKDLFSGKTGIANQLDAQIGGALAAGGTIDSRSQMLVKQSNALDAQTSELNKQMDAMTKTLTQQYSSLNVLLSSLQTTSAYLTQAIAALPSFSTKPGG